MESSQDLKDRLFKEAHAMVAYIAARGIDKKAPDPELIKLLDTTKDVRKETALSDVLALHQNLASIVAPAFPETIRKLYEFRENAKWRAMIAPLGSVLFLIICAILLIVGLGVGFIPFQRFGGNPFFYEVLNYLQGDCRFSIAQLAEAYPKFKPDLPQAEISANLRDHFDSCQAQRRPLLIEMYLFFGILGMLGAAYSSIYDSFTYIREGRYDMRLASTYFVRILLGGISGVILAGPLGEYFEYGTVSSTVLAFLGGFSAQLVYDLLTKLVDSLANMFRADRRKEQQALLAQAQISAQGLVIQDDAAKKAVLARLLAAVHGEADPALKGDKLQAAILEMLSGKATPIALDDQGAVDPLAGDVQGAMQFAALSAQIADLLPDAPSDSATQARAALTRLQTAAQALSAGATAQTKANARAALAAATSADLVTDRVGQGVSDLRDALSGSTLSGIAKGGLMVSSAFAPGQIARWRYLAYRAITADVTLLDGLAPEALGDGLPRPDGGLIDAAEIVTRLKAGEADQLFAQDGADFADRDSFDQAIANWIDAVVQLAHADEIDSRLLPLMGPTLSGSAIVDALAKVADSAKARGGLQRLEMVGAGVPQTPQPEAVLGALRRLAESLLDTQGAAS